MSAQHEHRDYGDTDGHDDDSEHDLAQRIQQHTASPGRPSSIDMALNLERQLDAEHEEHEHEEGAFHGQDHQHGQGARPVSLDPLVLSSIVENLRAELARVAQERDALADALSSAPSREAELREALALLTERCTSLEQELERFRRKSQDDDDAINMLRTKVEESRRGLMRLQTESKRMSQMSVDTGRANMFFGAAPTSSKRASFTPLTGSGAARIHSHRRISSVSEPSFMGVDDDTASMITSPATHVFSLPEDGSSAAAAEAKKARRSSSFFSAGRAVSAPSPSSSPSPPTRTRTLAPELSVSTDTSNMQLEALRRERDAVRAELAAARGELSEAQEAREASEQCVTALRAFISEHAVGENGGSIRLGAGTGGLLKLPPLPTDKNTDLDEDAQKTRQGSSGWSFGKLWRADSSSSVGSGSRGVGSSASESNANTPASETAPIAVVMPPTPVASSPSTPATMLSRKLGGFFSARAPSISSIASIGSTAPSATKVRPPTAYGQQEPTMNGLGSDDEELVSTSADEGPLEPVSPTREPGAAASRVLVRDTASVSDFGVGETASLKGAAQIAAPAVAMQLESSA
ncbi:hypothetical protein M0805_001410 [Coniferiporia weirii]|nr:hypothetical protein M0805_001410 [Coniferiporia weirii]